MYTECSCIDTEYKCTDTESKYISVPKLSIYFVHPQGAEGLKIVHPANLLCVQAYKMYRNTQK